MAFTLRIAVMERGYSAFTGFEALGSPSPGIDALSTVVPPYRLPAWKAAAKQSTKDETGTAATIPVPVARERVSANLAHSSVAGLRGMSIGTFPVVEPFGKALITFPFSFATRKGVRIRVPQQRNFQRCVRIPHWADAISARPYTPQRDEE